MAVTVMQPFEPKTTNRFIFYIGGIPSYIIKATTLPALDNSEIRVRYINSSFKVKGLSEWQDIDVTLYDPVDPTGAAAVRNWVIQHHLSVLGIDGSAFGFDPFQFQIPGGNPFSRLPGPLSTLAQGATPGNIIDSPLGYKKHIDIKYLNPRGEEFQGWKLFGAYIKNANWGELDWSRGDALEIKLTLTFDYAVLI